MKRQNAFGTGQILLARVSLTGETCAFPWKLGPKVYLVWPWLSHQKILSSLFRPIGWLLINIYWTFMICQMPLWWKSLIICWNCYHVGWLKEFGILKNLQGSLWIHSIARAMSKPISLPGQFSFVNRELESVVLPSWRNFLLKIYLFLTRQK